MIKLVCLALGSRGDAQPLLDVLCRAIADVEHAVHVTFACRPSVWTELQSAPHAHRDITHVPIRECTVCMSVALAARRKGLDPQTVDGAGGISAEAADAFLLGERADMITASQGASLVICNLFCLEGFHIAEALRAECVVLSPCLPPQGMPAGFEEQFARTLPTLYRRLVEEQEQQRQTGCQLQPFKLPDASCSWDDIALWMWRLFLDDHGDWRREVLRLEPSPLDSWDDPGQTVALPRRTVILFGVSPSLAALVLSKQGCLTAGQALARANKGADDTSWIGLGTADAVKPLSVAANPRVGLCCGPWRHLSEVTSLAHGRLEEVEPERPALPEELKHFISNPEGQRGIACVCFGSMPGLGYIRFAHDPNDHLDGDCKDEISPGSAHSETDNCEVEGPSTGPGVRALKLLMQAMKQLGLRGVWMLRGWPPDTAQRLRQFAKILGRKQNEDFMTTDGVPHGALLPCCSVMVHHGGAGTVATCLMAGCAQIICPIAFDQHAWAAVLSENKVAVDLPLLQQQQQRQEGAASSAATPCGGAGGEAACGPHKSAHSRRTNSFWLQAQNICEAFRLAHGRLGSGSLAARLAGREEVLVHEAGAAGQRKQDRKRARETASCKEPEDVAASHARCKDEGAGARPCLLEARGKVGADQLQGMIQQEARHGTLYAAGVLVGLLNRIHARI